MSSLKSCLGIHAAPPELANEIRKKMKDYQESGFTSQDAVEAAIKDVQGSLRSELDQVHAQIKKANPRALQDVQNEKLSPEEQQLADLKAAGVTVASFSDSLLDSNVMIERLSQKMGGVISKEEIAQVIGTVEGRYEFLKKRLASGVTDIKREFRAMGIDQYIKASDAEFMAMTPDERIQELAKADLQKALTEKKESIRRKMLSEKRNSQISADLDSLQAQDANRSRSDALIDYLVGDLSGRANVQNLQAKAKGFTDEFMQPLVQPLRPFFSAVRGLVMTADDYASLVRELIEPNTTGNGKIAKLAQAINDVNGALRARLNKAGADIGYIEGYIPQSWHRRKVMFAGLSPIEAAKLILPTTSRAELIALTDKARNNYVEFMFDKLDRNHRAYVDKVTGEQMSDAQIRQMLRGVFDTLATDGASKGESQGGSGSLALRLSAERSLFFKDADSFLAANDRFGNSDVITTMMSHIQSRSKDLALMENMDADNFQKALANAKAEDGKTSGGFLGSADRAEAIWMELSGSRPSSGTGLLNDTLSSARSWMVYTKLGSALLSQPSDVPTFALMAVKDGLGFAPAIREIASALNPLNKADRVIAEDLGLAIESVYQDAGSRFMDATNDKSFAGKLAQFTIKAGGMKWWTDSMKRGFHILVARGIARERGKGYDALEPAFKAMLERNGIDAATWDTIRQTKAVDLNGREVITPASVADPTARAKMFGMFADEADYGVLEPGARERSLILGKSESGSWQGETMKSFALFKMFSVSMMTKTIPRLFSNLEGSKSSYAQHMAAYSLAMIGMGAFSTQLKEIVKGRNPRDMQDAKFWIQAAGQSGGLGVFGDFLFGDVNRMGNNIATTLAGPLASTAGDVLKLTAGNVQELAQGKPTKAAAETIQFIKNNSIPNLWYTKQAIDTLLFNRAQESVNPGYLQRMQSRIERENKTSFWWKPNEAVPTEAPDFTTIGGR